MSKNIYTLVTSKDGNKVSFKFRNFTVATNGLIKAGAGRLYQGKKLVGEL